MVWTCDEIQFLNWLKKCMEIRVESKTTVGRPRSMWIESVEVNMA